MFRPERRLPSRAGTPRPWQAAPRPWQGAAVGRSGSNAPPPHKSMTQTEVVCMGHSSGGLVGGQKSSERRTPLVGRSTCLVGQAVAPCRGPGHPARASAGEPVDKHSRRPAWRATLGPGGGAGGGPWRDVTVLGGLLRFAGHGRFLSWAVTEALGNRRTSTADDRELAKPDGGADA